MKGRLLSLLVLGMMLGCTPAANALTYTLTISPKSGSSPLSTTWVHTVTLTSSASEWQQVQCKGINNGQWFYSDIDYPDDYGPGTFTWGWYGTITLYTGSWACFGDIWGTTTGTGNWHYELGPYIEQVS